MIARIIDYFIKDKNTLTEDEYIVKRLVVVVLIILFAASAILAIIPLFGIAETEMNIAVLISTGLILILFYFSKNELLPYSFLVIIFTLLAIYNINITGYIFSYNHKWFFPIAMFVVFVKRQWFIYISIVIILLQCYYFLISSESRMTGNNPDISRSQELGDNITFFLISFAMLYLFERFISGRTQRISKNQELLKIRSEELLQSNQELERFAYIASHDIKTPLRNIISFSSLLERELAKNGTKKSFEYLEYIKSGSQKLNSLVEDLLTYSKLSNESLHIVELVDMNEIADEIKSHLSDFVQKKKASILIPSKLPKIKTQRIWVLGLMQNLIENGLKYNNSEQPTIEISHSYTQDNCIIKFKDNGIGIDEKYHNSIFDMFSRLHAEGQFEGTGLGLAFCKKTIEKLDGQIQIKSQIGKGSEFSLIISRDIIFE